MPNHINSKLLKYLKNHKIILWIFFIAAIIGAITTIVSVPIKIYQTLSSYKDVTSEEKESLQKITSQRTGITFGYVKSIFGEPKEQEKCEKNAEYSTCIFPKISNSTYTFDKTNFSLKVVLDKEGNIFAYTITAKNPDFKVKIELFLGRFFDKKVIQLGKTKFNELQVRDKGTAIFPILGNNFGQYSEILYIDDYAMDSFYILRTSSEPEWKEPYNGFNCDYTLLNQFDESSENFVKLSEEKYQDNLDIFRNTCPIQEITIVNLDIFNKVYGDKIFSGKNTIEDEMKNTFLKDFDPLSF